MRGYFFPFEPLLPRVAEVLPLRPPLLPVLGRCLSGLDGRLLLGLDGGLFTGLADRLLLGLPERLPPPSAFEGLA